MVRDWRIDTTSRRLGERRALPAHTEATLLVKRKSALRRSPRRVSVHLDNVSVTGVGFFVPDSESFVVGQLVTFELGGVASALRLRRVEQSTSPGWTYLGAEFADPRPAVMPVIERLLMGHALDEREARWQGNVR